MGRKQDNLPVAALESCDQETLTQQGKCEAYVLGCLLKSTLILLHKHAYTHTNKHKYTYTHHRHRKAANTLEQQVCKGIFISSINRE